MDLAHQRDRSQSGIPTLIVCKPAYEAALREEIAAKLPGAEIGAQGPGWLVVQGRMAPGLTLVFERQRIVAAHRIEGSSRKALAEAAWHALAGAVAGAPWTLHAYAPDPTAPDSLQKRAAGIGQEFLARTPDPAWRAAWCDPLAAASRGAALRVVQLCLTEQGLHVGCSPSRALSAPWPGGVHHVTPAGGRPRLDADRAPSRSAMKIEEALEMFGETPRPGQRAVDLGAAPGGWTLAFLRRGCGVTAVDRALLKIGGEDEWGGLLEHRREDGLRYHPPAPVDWLLSDMLVPPGVTLGLLRKWIGEGWARRFVVNLKLPQEHPYSAVRPVEAFLAEAPLSGAGIRHLHHDRREVTLWGRVEIPRARQAPARKRTRRR